MFAESACASADAEDAVTLCSAGRAAGDAAPEAAVLFSSSSATSSAAHRSSEKPPFYKT
jgi:hypothetical protein